MGLLKVVGVGTKSYPVDSITLTINIIIKNKEYDEVISKEQEAFKYLKNLFQEELKTDSYRVDQYTEYKENVIAWKGYKIHHALELKLKYDFELLGKTLDLVSQTPHHPEFYITYTTENVDEDQLKQLAIKNAFHQAKIIASEAKVELKNIHLISTQINAPNQVLYARSEMMHFEDIEHTVEILVEWEI